MSEQMKQDNGINYLVYVNGQNPVDESWEKMIAPHLVTCTNHFEGDDTEYVLEKQTYEQFEKLRTALLELGIRIELDSATRTIAKQQAIIDEFTAKFGAEYARKYAARPGYSEHHTGLALDTALVIDGKYICDNDEMMAQKEINEVIWSKLADYGFILRYPGKNGGLFESWHYRYVGSPEVAHEIMDNGLTLDEYLAMKK